MVFNPVLFTSLLISWLLIHLSFRNSGSNVTTLCQEKNMKGMELQLGFGVSQWILWDIKCFTERNAETRRMDRSTGMFFPNLWVDRLFLYLFQAWTGDELNRKKKHLPDWINSHFPFHASFIQTPARALTQWIMNHWSSLGHYLVNQWTIHAFDRH